MDNLVQHNPKIVTAVQSRTKEQNESRLKEIETKIKDCLDLGLGVPNNLRAESIVIVDYMSKL